MTISHHSHSGEFCLHAKGTLVEVVEEAIRQGFTTFGLSEHVPRYKLEHLYPEEVRSLVLNDEGRRDWSRSLGSSHSSRSIWYLLPLPQRSESTERAISGQDNSFSRTRNGVHRFLRPLKTRTTPFNLFLFDRLHRRQCPSLRFSPYRFRPTSLRHRSIPSIRFRWRIEILSIVLEILWSAVWIDRSIETWGYWTLRSVSIVLPREGF